MRQWIAALSSFIKTDDGRKRLVPQIVQSSMMDCGPASLKALLEGYGINVSYGRLREACQTDVDGTSIESLEDLAVQLGLDAAQVMLPADHLLLPESEALPAIAVTRLPNGFTHFVVIWQVHGPLVQIMDPGTGRQWISHQRLQEMLYIHKHPLEQEQWYDWASGPGFCEPLAARMLALCPDPPWVEASITAAIHSGEWKRLAILDAATRMVQSLQRSTQAIRSPKVAGELIARLQEQPELIPPAALSVMPMPDDSEQVVMQGAVVVSVAGLTEESLSEETADQVSAAAQEEENEQKQHDARQRLLDSLTDAAPEPEKHIWGLVRKDGLLSPSIIVAGVVLAALGTALEVLVMRSLLEIGQQMNLISQQFEAYALVVVFMFSFLILQWLLTHSVTRMGRRLEIRLRQQFLEKLSRLGDRYFRSRLNSDLIQRAHELHDIRGLPTLAMGFAQQVSQLLFVSVGLIIIYPQGFMLVLMCTALVIATAFMTRPMMQEQDMRFRTHTGSLSRFYLDALQGLLPIRSHGAEDALQTEHERNLVEWAKAGNDSFSATERVILINGAFETLVSIWLVMSFLKSGGDSSGTLILIYWLMMLPKLGQSVIESAQQYPSLHNRLLRILEPLNTPDESYDWYSTEEREAVSKEPKVNQQAASIRFCEVDLMLSGHSVLQGLDTQLNAGEHVAIVGASGAGKSSLAGLLLGWYKPSAGQVRVDGELLEGECLQTLRRQIAWVDPDVQLWNRSLAENINYGQAEGAVLPPQVLSQADLLGILERLEQGEHTLLGEEGRRLSGGEGQRVRFGRALRHENPRLVILDEPFRGLTRDQRQRLLKMARQYWQNTTLIFISHDIQDTLDFDRVWVVDQGALAEDDKPEVLLDISDGQYRRLLELEQSARDTIWNSASWIRFWLDKGKLHIKDTPVADRHRAEGA